MNRRNGRVVNELEGGVVEWVVEVFTLELSNCGSYSTNYLRRDTEVGQQQKGVKYLFAHFVGLLPANTTTTARLAQKPSLRARDWNRFYDNQGDFDLLIVTAKTIRIDKSVFLYYPQSEWSWEW